MENAISTLCAWGDAREVSTKVGNRILRKAAPTQLFWDAWKADKNGLKDAGISVCRNERTAEWEVCWWAPLTAEAAGKKEASFRASYAVDADLVVPVPERLTLMPFQRAGVRYALERRDTLFADEMGLGKTVQAIGFANVVSPASVLIVCPASLKINWQREWAKWSTLGQRVSIATATDWDEEAQVHIVNYDVLSKRSLMNEISQRTWGLLVADECHYAKNPKAARTRALFSIRAARRLFLTGTPVLNRPIELYPILKAMGVPFAASWEKYARRYCAAYRTRYGWDTSGASNAEELAVKLRETVMVRRSKHDVLKDLPDKTVSMVVLPANGASRDIEAESNAWSAYERDTATAKAQIARLRRLGRTDSDEYREAVRTMKGCLAQFSQIARLRHLTALRKVPHVVEAAFDTIDSAGCCVIFAHHKDVIEGIVAGLQGKGVTTQAVTGDTGMAERQLIVDGFQAGNLQAFVGSIKACGTGLTLTQSSNVIFAELDWTPSVMAQAEDRCHRIGQRNAVTVRHLVFDGTIDALLAKMLIEKTEIIDSIMADELQ